MSATNRGGKREADDNYSTPAWCVERLLECEQAPQLLREDGLWLEPCAGNGAIIRAVKEWRRARDMGEPRWCANELRSECEMDIREAACAVEWVNIGDFLSAPAARLLPFAANVSVVITNPPFSLAEEFVRKSCEIAPLVVMLLRVNFYASEGRAEWLRETEPSVYILPNRPSFKTSVRIDKNGKKRKSSSDSCEYAWFVWSRNRLERGRVVVLRSTQAHERKHRPPETVVDAMLAEQAQAFARALDADAATLFVMDGPGGK